jgi:2-methylisocitrate lyase-like PEP mutase family enzyme
MNKSQKLKKLLNKDKTLVMPDAYNPISAQLIEKAGYMAVQCSGYSFAMAAGYDKEADLYLSDNLIWTQNIVEAVDIPVMADAEDGYGGPEEVLETVERFMKTGVAGLNLEDQIPDERNQVSVIDEEEMMKKIMIAREIAEINDNPDFIINGRTDALKATNDRGRGLDLAIQRANQYLLAGADLVFIPYVETLDEVKKITREVNGLVSIAAGMSYNCNNFSIQDLRDCGVARVSYPTLLLESSISAMDDALNLLRNNEK